MATTSSPVHELYVVTWWEGQTRRHRVMADKISAGMGYHSLKERSRDLVDVSLEPIRMIPQRIFTAMEQLQADNDNRTCHHNPRLLRLCIPCLGGMIPHANS